MSAAVLVGSCSICVASHYEVVTPGDKSPIQCLVQDLRHPKWSNGHYIACYSQYFSTREKWGGYFYGGFVAQPQDAQSLLQFCSWQMSGKGVPAADIAFAYAGLHMSWERTTWEGCAGGIKGFWPKAEFQPNQWHRFVARTWASADDPGHSYVGIWLKNLETGEWHHLTTTRYPGVIDNLNSFFGFQENFWGEGADPIAAVDIRNTYTQRDGRWVAADKVLFRAQGSGDSKERLCLKAIDGGTAVSLQTFYPNTGKATKAQKNDSSFVPVNQELLYNQPAQPTFFDPVEVASLGAQSCGSQLYVKWDLAQTSCPQLGYKLEVFRTAKPKGEPLLVLAGDDPERRSLLVDLKAGASASVRLTLTDIYGREGAPIVRAANALQPAPASKPGHWVSGLNYRYFEAPAGTLWDHIPDFSPLAPIRRGAVAEPELSPRLRRTEYAFDFNGRMEIETSGIYDFDLVHASGGRLIVDGRTVIDADGYHSIGSYSGAVALAKGAHRFSLQYVQGERQSQQADDFLQILWAGPGSAGRPSRIPTRAFWREREPGEPGIVLTPRSGGSDGRVSLTAKVSGLGDKPYRIQYYISNPDFDYFRAQGAQGGDFFIGESKSASAPLDTMLWGALQKTVRARLIYRDDRTVDSAPVTFDSPTSSLGPWTLTELEHHQYPVAARVDGDSISLVGESMALLTQPVSGDCTLIAHLATITPGTAGPDGTAPEAGQWQAGIILRNDLGASPGEPLGGNTQYVALLGAADGSVRDCDSLMKSGAGNQPSENLGGSKRWMKLERKGSQFTEFLSEDGQTWTVVKTVILPQMRESIHAGLFIYALPSAIGLLHHASFDHVVLTQSRVR